MTTPETPAKTTLAQFIIRNEKVLAAIGVFVALSAFFITLPLKSLSAPLAFCCLVATLPLVFEVARDLYKTKSNLSLLIFGNVFTFFIGYLFWYVLIAFREQWWTRLHIVVFWIIFLGLIALYRKFFRDYYQRFFRHVGFYAERLLVRVWTRLTTAQLRMWNRLHIWNDRFLFGRSRFSALRWRIRRDREMIGRPTDMYEDQREKRWRQGETSDGLQNLGTIILFIPIWFAVGAIEKPVAERLNFALDIQAEEYQQLERNPEKLGFDPYAVPPPTESPTPVDPALVLGE